MGIKKQTQLHHSLAIRFNFSGSQFPYLCNGHSNNILAAYLGGLRELIHVNEHSELGKRRTNEKPARHEGTVWALESETVGKLLSSQASVSPHTKPMIPQPWAHCKGSDEIVYVKLLEHRRASLNVRSLPYPLSQHSSWKRLFGFPELFFFWVVIVWVCFRAQGSWDYSSKLNSRQVNSSLFFCQRVIRVMWLPINWVLENLLLASEPAFRRDSLGELGWSRCKFRESLAQKQEAVCFQHRMLAAEPYTRWLMYCEVSYGLCIVTRAHLSIHNPPSMRSVLLEIRGRGLPAGPDSPRPTQPPSGGDRLPTCNGTCFLHDSMYAHVLRLIRFYTCNK